MSNIPDPFIKTNSRIPLQGRAPELHNYNQPGALQKPGMNTPSQAAPTDSGQHAQMTRKILPDLAFSSPQLQYVGNQHGGPQKMPTVKADPVAEEKDSVDAQDVKRRKDTVMTHEFPTRLRWATLTRRLSVKEFHNYVPDMI